MSPRINKKALLNKTIQAVDDRAVNVLGLIFTDGTRIDLEVEALGSRIYGIVTCDCFKRSQAEVEFDAGDVIYVQKRKQLKKAEK